MELVACERDGCGQYIDPVEAFKLIRQQTHFYCSNECLQSAALERFWKVQRGLDPDQPVPRGLE